MATRFVTSTMSARTAAPAVKQWSAVSSRPVPSMSDTASSAPCLAKAIASARPIPEPAPVITTTRPLKDCSALRWRARLSPLCRLWGRELTLRRANVYAPFASRALDWVSAWFSRPVPASIRSSKMVAYFAMWGPRQMVTCVQADRFARYVGDWELDSADFRTGAHDGESIPNFRSRCHSECYSLSWRHSRQIRPTHSSERPIDDRLSGSGPATLNQGENSRSWDAIGALQLRGHPVRTGERPVVDVPDDGAAVHVE